MGKLFGTDGIRGVANTELTPELAFRVGRAATYYFITEKNQKISKDDKPKIYVGHDTRISSQMLVSALEAGICSSGGEVVRLGPVPTPAVAYLASKYKAAFGIAVTASHNPFADNGIKFFSSDGYKLPDAVESEIEDLILSPQDNMPRPSGYSLGGIVVRPKLLREYTHHIKDAAGNTNFNGMKIVIDCANGAAFESTPLAFKQLGAQITVLNSQPDGYNINDNCGSTHMNALREAVVKYGADLGLAHDGDADRCLAVDETGEIVDGDQIMLICALEMMKEKKLAQNTLVTTVMSNIGLYKAIRQNGFNIVTTPVGDRYVLEEMLAKGLNLGGEQSGHIIFTDHSTTGDGLLTAVKLTAALKNNGKKLSEMAALMVRYPQLLVNVRVRSKEGLLDNPSIKKAIAAGEEKLGDDGRILVRMSGTEPLLRIMGEGPSQAELEKIVKEISDTVQKEQGQ